MSDKPPRKFYFTENCGKQWKIGKQSFEIYLKATGLSEKDNDVQVAASRSIMKQFLYSIAFPKKN